MTQKAREVLEDCRVALSEVQDGIMGRQWRVRWVACVALLRAVGHVLSNVDASNDPLLAPIVKKAWDALLATKPQPTIFWEFIQQERNNILKEYRLGAGQGVTIRLGCDSNLYHYLMNEGPYQGLDQRDVLQKAINWWDGYLADIEDEHRKAQT